MCRIREIVKDKGRKEVSGEVVIDGRRKRRDEEEEGQNCMKEKVNRRK